MNELKEKPLQLEFRDTEYEKLEPSSDFLEKENKRRVKAKQKYITNQHKIEERKRRQQQKLESKLNKLKYHNETRHSKRKWFTFFTKWFFIGLGLISVSVVLSTVFGPQTVLGTQTTPEAQAAFDRVIAILAGTLSTVGIALMIGAIFDFSKNSEAFIQFVSDILSDIVISKTFLRTLSDKDKEHALALILKPTDKQIEQYSNINAFFDKRIKELTTMFDINFKTHVTLNITAYMDYRKSPDGKIISEDKIVYCKTVLTQTMYKFGDTYKPVQVLFEKEGSQSLDVVILPPEGEEKTISGIKSSKEVPPEGGGIYCDMYTYEIPKEFEKYDHLTIKRTMLEPGYDHWINYYWESLTPYEGVICIIDCMEPLTVKDYMIFDNKAYYHVKKSTDSRRLEITSSQWLNTDTGFVVTISDTKPLDNGPDKE